jgi:hypothetical protein
MDISEIKVSVNPQDVYNIVVVEGANINGVLMDATAKNTNIKSPTNIAVWEPKTFRIHDENIPSFDLAQKRADYELFKKSLLQFDISFDTIFLPHLDVNQVVTITSDFLNFNKTRCLITNISIPLSYKSQYSITAKNIEEVGLIK